MFVFFHGVVCPLDPVSGVHSARDDLDICLVQVLVNERVVVCIGFFLVAHITTASIIFDLCADFGVQKPRLIAVCTWILLA
jgi:hypothetical protein